MNSETSYSETSRRGVKERAVNETLLLATAVSFSLQKVTHKILATFAIENKQVRARLELNDCNSQTAFTDLSI